MADESEFARTLRRLRLERGLSVRRLGAEANYSKTYVSELEHGAKPPTAEVARCLDDALGARGELARLAPGRPAVSVPPFERVESHVEPLGERDVVRLYDTVRHLVALDTLHGSDGLSASSARAVRTTQRHLAVAGVADAYRRDLYASLAELGEVAAWLAFDSEQQDESRRLAHEALLNARIAGDTAMARFLMSHLSMQALYLDRPAEALDLAGRVLADDPRSRRVVGMMRVRRARAIGKAGSTAEALKELERARGELGGGVGPDDPAWTWWWNPAELARHESHIKLAGGEGRGAVDASERAVALVSATQGRDRALYRAGLLTDLVEVGAWHDADRVAAELVDVASGIGSARVPRIIRTAERRAVRAGAPAWAIDAIHEAARSADPAT